MLIQEFVTSAQHGLPIKVFVFNNGGWGLVRLEMEEAGLPVFSEGANVRNPDFALYAQVCGGAGFRVARPEALHDAVATALATPGPVIVDVTIDPGELPSTPHLAPATVWRVAKARVKEFVGEGR